MITRLGDAFVKLIEAGDVGYLKWKKEFRCDVNAAKAQGDQYYHKISKEIEYFEQRFESWKIELMEFRRKFPLANHFTVKQILVIRRYLKQYSSDSKQKLPSKDYQVFALLRSISNEVTPHKIKECCSFMHVDIGAIHNKSKEVNKPVDNRTNFTRFSYKELQSMVDAFVKENKDIDRNLIYASLMDTKVNFSNEKEVFLWCGKHEDDNEDKIEDLSDEAEKQLNRMKENALE